LKTEFAKMGKQEAMKSKSTRGFSARFKAWHAHKNTQRWPKRRKCNVFPRTFSTTRDITVTKQFYRRGQRSTHLHQARQCSYPILISSLSCGEFHSYEERQQLKTQSLQRQCKNKPDFLYEPTIHR